VAPRHRLKLLPRPCRMPPYSSARRSARPAGAAPCAWAVGQSAHWHHQSDPRLLLERGVAVRNSRKRSRDVSSCQ